MRLRKNYADGLGNTHADKGDGLDMKWLFVICAEDDGDYRKQKEQWQFINSTLATGSVSLEAVVYRKGYPVSIIGDMLELSREERYDGILVAAGDYTEEITGNYAAHTGCSCMLGVSDITWMGHIPLFHKYVYQSNMEAVFQMEPPFAAGLALWKKKETNVYSDKKLCERPLDPPFEGREGRMLIKSGIKQKESDILLAVGKGVQSREEVQNFKALAINEGYMFGVTRPVAMNGWAGIDEIIGVSGRIYSPKVCITIGVSGSAAFYAGVENSEWIASVNTDEHAPIIRMSDVAVIDDYKNIWGNLHKWCERMHYGENLFSG